MAKQKTKTSLRSVDVEQIRSVARSAQLHEIRLVSFTAECQRPIIETDIAGLTQEIVYSAERIESDPEFVATWLDCSYSASDNEGKLAEVAAAYVTVYRISSEENAFPEEALDVFAEINGVYNTWPYLREFVTSSMARLGIHGIVLPVWRVPDQLPPKGQPVRLRRTALSA